MPEPISWFLVRDDFNTLHTLYVEACVAWLTNLKDYSELKVKNAPTLRGYLLNGGWQELLGFDINTCDFAWGQLCAYRKALEVIAKRTNLIISWELSHEIEEAIAKFFEDI